MKKSLLLVINEDRFFLSHRTRLAEKAMENGWEVTLVTKDTGRRQEIEAKGFKYIELPINPTGMKLKDEIKTFRFLFKLFKNNKESIIHLVGLKNMLWGGLASKLVNSKGVLYAVSGLGTLFGEERNRNLAFLIQKFLRFSMNRNNTAVIFQNRDDQQLFTHNVLTGKTLVYFTKGSGVDLNQYSNANRISHSPLRIIFTARMIREKGVEDLVKAAEILRARYFGKIEFWLCGDISDNPNAITLEELGTMIDGEYIKWFGFRRDIPGLLRQCDIMCFPSYYREGVPRSLLEASAVGLPIVTTDSVGCRDTVEHGKNGFLVSPHSPEELASALENLILDENLRNTMGEYSRHKALREYDVEDVASIHFDIYQRLNQEL